MNRGELAKECARIEKSGGNVLDYLKGVGCISPWGTWHRLQKEELRRQDWQITDGKGNRKGRNCMKSVLTDEQKEKAVEIALDSGSSMALAYLKEHGSKNPSAALYAIKKQLQKKAPEKYAALKASAGPLTTCCAPAMESGVEVPDVLPGDITAPIARMTISDEAVMNAEPVMEELQTTGLLSPKTGFRYEYDSWHGTVTWRTGQGDEVSMTAEEWLSMMDEFPKVMNKFRIEKI